MDKAIRPLTFQLAARKRLRAVQKHMPVQAFVIRTQFLRYDVSEITVMLLSETLEITFHVFVIRRLPVAERECDPPRSRGHKILQRGPVLPVPLSDLETAGTLSAANIGLQTSLTTFWGEIMNLHR